MTWQPIETAPKDGAEFLAYDPVSNRADVCEWNEMLGCVWQSQADGEFGPDEGEFRGDSASHWMPLPQPPETQP